MASVEISGLRVTYHAIERVVRALDGLDMRLDDGEPVAIIGPSGCGKSTLLLTLAGLVAPDGGRVLVAEEPVTGPRRRTALILQGFGLLPWKTVEHNVALGLEIRGIPDRERRRVVLDALERLGLAGFAHAYPGELSGGMQQRVALARALALDADLLLMDEPLSALDALTREDLQNLLLALWRQRGHTAVLVTHSIEEAVFLGRRILVLSPRPGRVAAVIENPEMGETAYRSAQAFLKRCVEVRRVLEAEGAYGTSGPEGVAP